MDDATAAPAPVFDPLAPGFATDPYPAYEALRELAPVARQPLGFWALTRYEHCHRVLRDPSLSVEETPEERALRRGQLAALSASVAARTRAERGTRAILNIDPPDHDRIRRLVSRAFTPRRVAGLRPLVQRLADELLDGLEERARAGEHVDLIAELAFPLPFLVISEMLGMPPGDRHELRAWSHTLAGSLEPTAFLDPAGAAAILEAADRMTEVVEAAVAHKRAHPADDLLTVLIQAEEGGASLSADELRDNVVLLFIAGHETTVNLIGNGTLALARHPDQARAWRDDPSIGPGAVDELLRYDAPVQLSRRRALAPFELDGHRIEAGDFLITVLGSANRDPRQWGPTADQLDLRRPASAQHLSFGSGVHHCLGASLARLEAEVAVGSLLRRFERVVVVDDEPAWNQRVVLRGLDHLHLALA